MISHCENRICSYLKWKVKIVYPLNSDWKDRSDWWEDNNNLRSRASSSPTFKKLLLSRDFVEVRYHYTLTCEDDVTLTHEFMTPRMYNKVPINDLSYIKITTTSQPQNYVPTNQHNFYNPQVSAPRDCLNDSTILSVIKTLFIFGNCFCYFQRELDGTVFLPLVQLLWGA